MTAAHAPSGPIRLRMCAAHDVLSLMAFFSDHWWRDHVLATSRRLLDWQHRDADDSYTYVLAEDDGGIVGAIGYIRSSRYDSSLVDEDTLWIALWVVRQDLRASGIGLRLLNYVLKGVPHRSVAVNGINTDLPPLYRALGFTSVFLVQHVAMRARTYNSSLVQLVQPRAVVALDPWDTQRI